jgi:hypothetical protein
VIMVLLINCLLVTRIMPTPFIHFRFFGEGMASSATKEIQT